MIDAQPIGETNDFAGLQRIIRARKDALRISNLTLAEISGLPEGICNG